jgi:hypothetical protein
VSIKLASAKRKRDEEVLLSLHCTGRTKAAEKCNVLKKNKGAMEIRMRLNKQKNVELANKLKAKKMHLELVECNLHMVEKIKLAASTLAEYNKKLKGRKSLARYYDGKEVMDSTVTSNEKAMLCHAIENEFSCLKGKHATTKARMLMEAIMSGGILNGEVAVSFQAIIKQYIRSLF